MESLRRNWIGGVAQPAVSGRTFLPWGSRGRSGQEDGEEALAWAASGEEDAGLALRALGFGPGKGGRTEGWRGLSSAQRREGLADLVRRLLECPDPGNGMAGLLGLEPAELMQTAQERAGRWQGAARAASGGERRPGVALVSVHWSAGIWGQLEAVLGSLALGWPTVLVTDPLLPCVGDALAAAAVDLSPDALAILHGHTHEVLPRLMRDGAVVHLVGSRPLGRLDELEVPWIAGPDILDTTSPHTGFGAGVMEHPPRGQSLSALSGRVLCLGDGGDAAEDARHLAREAFGRAGALSGQTAGRPSHILCPERRFSAFTEALLATLVDDLTLAPALPRRDPDGAHLLDRLRGAALDGGATLIFEGPTGRQAAETAGDGHAGSKKRPGGRMMAVAVFTNVEESMGMGEGAVAWPGPPVPALVLLRVKNEAHGRRLLKRHGAASPGPDPQR